MLCGQGRGDINRLRALECFCQMPPAPEEMLGAYKEGLGSQCPRPPSIFLILCCCLAFAQLRGRVLAERIALLIVELLVGNALGLDEVEELAESAAFLSAALVFIRVA